MQRRPRRHHRQHWHLLVSDDLQQCRPLRLNQPLQLSLHITWSYAPLCLDTHSVPKFDEVGIFLVGVGEAVFVE